MAVPHCIKLHTMGDQCLLMCLYKQVEYISDLQIYGGPESLSHDLKIWPITFQSSGPILFSCEKISL